MTTVDPRSDREDLAELLAAMSVAEKAQLVTGEAMWTTQAIASHGVPQMTVTDGPNGARGGGLLGTGTPTACIPSGSVLGATWDVELIEELGGLLGDECRAKGANVLLAPTINLHRHSLGGRNFECYSEDPVLTGRLAAAFVQGVQSRDVATTPKHFVANDSEFERNTIDVQVDERTLRELYLLPFEIAVREGGAWGVMSAYNRLNGTFCSEHEWLLSTVLRGEWGFDGFVVSDWYAMRSTADSVRAGMSLEMPGPGIYYGPEKIAASLAAGEIDEEDLNRIAADVLLALQRTRAFAGEGGGEEAELDRDNDRALIRRSAAAGTVMLRNDGVLPLDPATLTSIAVIGPNARTVKVMGGGSAKVRSYRATSPLDALTARLADRDAVSVTWAQGSNISRSVDALAAPELASMTVEYFSGHDLGGTAPGDTAPGDTALGETAPRATANATVTLTAAEIIAFGAPAMGMEPGPFSARAVGVFRVDLSGSYLLSMVQCGRSRVLLDGIPLIDASEGEFESGDSFFGFGTAEIVAPVELVAEREYELTIEYSNRAAVLLAGVRVGLVSLVERDLMEEAVTLAASSDIAIVVVGTNDDWETEGRDRDLFALPGDQPELIRQVAAANARTVVVVNAGGPHGLDWLDEPAAVLVSGFGGQEFGDALIDVLFGDVDPGGRMSNTVPADYAHSPALPNYPGENSVVRYGEGLFIGHRWFDARRIAPAAVLGEGMSYADFEWGTPRAVTESSTSVAEPIVVEVDITNLSDRSGSDVVQVYIEPPAGSPLLRPLRELKGFAKLHLASGETGVAVITLDARAFAYYDASDQVWETLASMSPVPAGGDASHRTEPGWYVEPGIYRLVVARSASDPVHIHEVMLVGDSQRL